MKPKRVCEISLKFPPPFSFPFFSLPPRLIILLLLKKLVGTSIQDLIENYVRAKREPPMIQVHLLKRRRKDVKVDPKLGGKLNVKEKHFSLLLTFPPTNLLKPSIFSFDLKVLLYHGPR
jgi:hypothetical protein